MFCPKCGKENNNNDRFCVQCGNDLSSNQNTANNSQLTDMFSTSSSSNIPEQTSTMNTNFNNNNSTLGGMYNQTPNNMNQSSNNINNNQFSNSNNQTLGNMYNNQNNNLNSKVNKNNNSNSTIKLFVTLGVAVVVFFLVSALLKGGSSRAGATCTIKKIDNNVVYEEEIKINQQKSKSGYYVSTNSTMKVYKTDHSTITNEQYDAFMKKIGELGLNQKSSNDGKTITITYSMSYLTVEKVSDAKSQLTSQGYSCH